MDFERDAQEYLQSHFIHSDGLAKNLGIPAHELLRLTSEKNLPGPSYALSRDGIASHIFGRAHLSKALDLADGAYYDRHAAAWLERPAESHDREYEQARAAFAAEMPILDLAAEWKNTFHHWQQGTYGVCVRQPTSFAAIVAKQVAAHLLTKMHEELQAASTPRAAEYPVEELKRACLRYDKYTKSFAPWDFHLSSRFRIYEPMRLRWALL